MYKEIREVANASGTLHKHKLLQKYAYVPGFKEVLKFIMSPYTRTGISDKKLLKFENDDIKAPFSFVEATEYFSAKNTGTDFDVMFAQAFINSWKHDEDAHWLAVGLVTKNLPIGVTIKTLNKVYPNFITLIEVMLGNNLKDVKNPVGPWIVTEKLDGHRRIMLKQNGVCSFYSRNGLEDKYLDVLLEDAAMLPDNYVYDGECLAIGNFKNSLDLRQATNSIMNSNKLKVGITFNVFDMIPISEYNTGKSLHTALERKATLCRAFGCTSLKNLSGILPGNLDYDFTTIIPVPIIGVAHTIKEALDFSKPIIARGFEGVMLNDVNSFYETKRSKGLLKVKDVKSLDLRVVDLVEGTGKFKGMLGSAIVAYKSFTVGVGSGFTDEERRTFWENKDLLLDHMIEVDTFGETTNMHGAISLNAPIFKGVRYDKDCIN